MRSDRYTKALLTVIAVCLSILTLAEMGSLGLAARAEASSGESIEASHTGSSKLELQEQKTPTSRAPRAPAPTSTLPLRWRIPTAVHRATASPAAYCATVISVRNLTDSTVSVDVEWINWDNDSLALRNHSLAARTLLQWATDDTVTVYPYWVDDDADIGAMIGYANINADDPRILVTATVLCRDGDSVTSKFVSQNEVPAFPVGATMEYFQAGMPASWAPPMAAPEAPE
jgi:hypothetical protein